jgi:hypothetical protein
VRTCHSHQTLKSCSTPVQYARVRLEAHSLGRIRLYCSSPEMLTGKRFRLKADTMGVGTVDDKRVAVTVPADAIIEVTGGPRPNDKRMVDVRWDGRALVMFVEDVQNRGEAVRKKRGET